MGFTKYEGHIPKKYKCPLFRAKRRKGNIKTKVKAKEILKT